MSDGFTVSIDDLQVTATTFARVQGEASDVVVAASRGLAAVAGMAGDDGVLAHWRGAYDPLAAAAWAATGTVADTVGGIAIRLTGAGNAYLAADHASVPGLSGAPDRLPEPVVGTTAAAPPPPSTGPTGIAVPAELAAYWPGGDPALLRAAAAAWAGLADGLDGAAFSADGAFRSLLGANSGAGFSAMAAYWARHYEFCGREPLLNAVPHGARLLARSCGGLADLIDSTRSRLHDVELTAPERDPLGDLRPR